MPLIRLLARLGWQRDPGLWTVPCRDLHGRRARLLIRLSPSGITLTATAHGTLHLTVLEVGRLLGAVRDAIRTCCLLTEPDRAESPSPDQRAEVAATPLDQPLATREVVPLERLPRPTVSELHARYQAPSL